MASVKPGIVGTAAAGPSGNDRVQQLEKQLEQITEERQKYYTLASKQDKTLKQYRAKWEDIKKSAREKDRTKKEKTEKPGEETLVSANEPWKASDPAA
jgi:F0F1-type ATP synthase membrane subunit b/b'